MVDLLTVGTVLFVPPLPQNIIRNAPISDKGGTKRTVPFVPPSLLLLPELCFQADDADAYESAVITLAKEQDALVVGGSQHAIVDGALHNRGLVVDPAGEVKAQYSKRHPYGGELSRGVVSGSGPAVFTWQGWRVAVMICADVWDSRLCRELGPIDLLCVVAQTVAEEHTPAAVRQLWHGHALSRAYEYACYVAISDWAEGTHADGSTTCGVAAIVDPTQRSAMLQVAEAGQVVRQLNQATLSQHREARADRQFLYTGNCKPVITDH